MVSLDGKRYCAARGRNVYRRLPAEALKESLFLM